MPSLNACVQNKQEPLQVDEGIRRFDCLCTTASHNKDTARNLVSIMFGRKLHDKMLGLFLRFSSKSSFLPPDFQRCFQVGFEHSNRRFSGGLKECIGTRCRYVDSFLLLAALTRPVETSASSSRGNVDDGWAHAGTPSKFSIDDPDVLASTRSRDSS